MPERVADGAAAAPSDVRTALLDRARQLLGAWTAPSSQQDALRADYLAHLQAHPDGLWRDGPPAHLTASCFVIDPSAEHVLLCLHGKGRVWAQLGGHLEPGDASLAAAALREAREESGLTVLTLVDDAPMDLHRHGLSAAFGRCDEHLDVAFAAVADPDLATTVSAESDDVAWWPVDALPDGVVSDLPGRLGALVSRVRG